jgi:hypothetical protein
VNLSIFPSLLSSDETARSQATESILSCFSNPDFAIFLIGNLKLYSNLDHPTVLSMAITFLHFIRKAPCNFFPNVVFDYLKENLLPLIFEISPDVRPHLLEAYRRIHVLAASSADEYLFCLSVLQKDSSFSQFLTAMRFLSIWLDCAQFNRREILPPFASEFLPLLYCRLLPAFE